MNARTKPISPIEITSIHGIKAAILSLALLLAGCGGGGGGGAPATVNGVTTSPAVQTQASANAFSTTSDQYGMQNATFLCSSKSPLGIVFRAAVASSLTDQNFKTVSRIDIAPDAAISTGTSYSLGALTAANRLFPGNIYFLNGYPSTRLTTVDGTISFTNFGANSGDRISGSYSAVVEDGNDSSTPKARYTIGANFDFTTDSYGPVPNANSDALAAISSYDANCASCHALGSHDTTTTGAGDLALKGGKLGALFSADQPGHQAIRLAASDISALKVLLNSN